jgi:hypothetical protein
LLQSSYLSTQRTKKPSNSKKKETEATPPLKAKKKTDIKSTSNEAYDFQFTDQENKQECVQVMSIHDVQNLNDMTHQWIEMDKTFIKTLHALTNFNHLEHHQLGTLNGDLKKTNSLVCLKNLYLTTDKHV